MFISDSRNQRFRKQIWPIEEVENGGFSVQTWTVFWEQAEVPGLPSKHRWDTLEEGTEPPNAHMGPYDELATHFGVHIQLG